MVDTATYVGAGILFAAFLALETLGKRGLMRTAVVDMSKLAVGLVMVSAWVFLTALPDTLLGAFLIAVVILLGALTAGAYAFFLRLFSGKSVREIWEAKDVEAQALRDTRAAVKRKSA